METIKKKGIALLFALFMSIGLLTAGAWASDVVQIVGGDSYTTLANAISAAGSGAEIQLLSNVAESVTVESGQTLTLNLGDHTLYGQVGNYGDLTIESGQEGKIEAPRLVISNYGTLTVNGGTIHAKEDYPETDDRTGRFTIVNYDSGNITVNNGTISADWYRALQNEGTGSITVNNGTISALEVAASNYGTGTMTITGGTLTASGGYTVQNENQGWTSGKVGTLTINGGTISTDSVNGYAIYNYDGGDVKISGTAKIEAPNANYVIYNYYSGLYIEGGEISAKGSSYAIYAIQSSEGQFVITGGKFSFDPSQQVGVIAEGYQVTQTDNMWTVEKVSASSDDPVTEDPATEYVAQIGDQKYATLVEATRAAKNGETVTVIADTNMGEAENYEVQILVENKAITLDLNGKTVTSIYGYRLAAVEPGGTLTIKDSSENGNGKLLNTKVPLSFTDTFQPTVVLVREGGTFVLESGTLEGNWFGVINNGGTVNITGGTVSANDNRGGNALKNVSGQTTISGGMFTGVAQMAAIDSTDGTISITGGTFSSDPSTPADYVAEGYKSVPNPDTTYYTVVPKVYVAEIVNGKKYETLQDAIDAAEEGDTITVYAGTVDPVYIDKSVTIQGTRGEDGEYLSAIKRAADWTVPEGHSELQDSTVYIAAPNVTLEDIKVEVSAATEVAFRNKATGADGFTVTNCWILGPGSGTAYNVQPGFVLQDSIIENWDSLNSLNISKHTAITITGNTYKNVSVLFKAQCSTVPNEKMVFSNNTLENDDGSKGYLEFGTYVTANGPAASGCAEVELALNQELKMAVAKPIKVTTSAGDDYIVSAANVTDGTWTRAYSVVRLADQVAKLSSNYGDQYYKTLQDAIDNTPDRTYPTITLLKDVDDGSSLAIFTAHPKNVTIDFNQHTYTISNPAVNSTDALHFENGSTITLKNGTLRVGEDASEIETLIQNNANLTLENMILDVSSMTGTSSFDVGTSGASTIKGNSQIILPENGEMSFSGSGGVATIENVQANGTLSASGNALVIKGGTFDSDPSAYVPKGYETIENDDGTWTVDSIKVAEVNGVKYASLDEAFQKAPNGSTIKVLLDIEGLDHTFKLQSYNLPSLTLDLDGHTIHVEKNNDPQYFAVFNVVWGYLTITGNGRVIADKGTNLRSAYTMTNYASIHIESGTFLCGDLFDTILHAYNGEITVTGGTFNNDPSAYVPDGYEVIILDKVDEVYGQLYKVVPIGTAEASINGAKYETLQGALAAVKATETITVLKDSALPEKGVTIPENVSIQTQEAVQDGYFTVPDGCLLLVEDSTYTAASNKVSKIELDLPEEITLSIPAGETATETITATLLPSYVTGKTVTWESSNTNVATVDENGVVTTVGSGTTTITASVVGEATATVTVTVEKFVARIGETKYETLDDAFEAAKETGATVIVVSDVAGEIPVGVTVVTEVEITGTFTAPDGYFLSVNGNTYTVAEKTITLNKTSVSMTSRTNAIATETLIATLNFETSSEVAWATSNDKVATVEKGVVTAVGTGTTTITASVDNLEARATVKVTMEYRVTVYIDGVKDSEVYRPENSRVDVNVIGRETMGAKNFQGWALNAPDAEIVGEDVIYGFTLEKDVDAYAVYKDGTPLSEDGEQPHIKLTLSLTTKKSGRNKYFNIDYSRALFLADGYTVKEAGVLYTLKTISDDALKLTANHSVPANMGITPVRDTNVNSTGFATSALVNTSTLSIRGYVILTGSDGDKVYYTDVIRQTYAKGNTSETYDRSIPDDAS